MEGLSKRDWLFVAFAAFVITGMLFVVLYWLYQIELVTWRPWRRSGTAPGRPDNLRWAVLL